MLDTSLLLNLTVYTYDYKYIAYWDDYTSCGILFFKVRLNQIFGLNYLKYLCVFTILFV